jgi:hypothetical protein
MSDESLRKAGRAELDRLNGAAAKPKAAEPPKKRKRVESSGYAGLLGIGKKKERRVGTEGDTVTEAVDKAVNGAKLSY